MDEGYEWLKRIADEMNGDLARGAAPDPKRLTVRQLLQRFGYQKRGDWINNHIRNGLEKFRLRTDQDFAIAWLDSPVVIELDSPRTPRPSDPTRRVGALDAANRKPVSVSPDSVLNEATTKMRMNGYSRLPVMRNERDVSGMVTWESIGARMALDVECAHVRDCMEPAEVIPGDTRLFDAIRKVSEHGYVLVRNGDRIVTGIVTATDLSGLFRQLAGPFLFIGEIEGHLRNLIHGKFTIEQLQAASGEEREIEGSADLTFGGYRRLLENKANWERLELGIDRREFIARLDSVRRIRNEVMHFNPDGLDEDQRREVRNVARFFDQLARMTAGGRPAEPGAVRAGTSAAPGRNSAPPGVETRPAPPRGSASSKPRRGPVRVVILGKEHESRNAMEATVHVLRELAERDSHFLERCSRHEHAKGSRCRYIARTSEELYPHREDFRERSAELSDGWLVATNMNNDVKSKILRMAAEVAGLTFGKDVVVEF